MRMSSGQYAILKELIVQPFIQNIAEAFPTDLQRCWSAIWYSLMGRPNSASVVLRVDKTSSHYAAIATFSRLFAGKVDLKSTFGVLTPSLSTLRLSILEAIIESLHEQYPDTYVQIYPKLDVIDEKLEGMDRIRKLFQQYMRLTQSGSIERYKVAYEILIIKEKLGLPSYFCSGDNIVEIDSSYCPGDFSYLDLSGLDLSRPVKNLELMTRHKSSHVIGGNFKGLIIRNSNCAKTTWDGIFLYGADFSGASLRGADFSRVLCRDHMVLIGADIEGTYFEYDHIPDRRAINFNRISLAKNQLIFFCHKDPSAAFVSNVVKLHDQAVIEQRHSNEEIQREYDKRFGIVVISQ